MKNPLADWLKAVTTVVISVMLLSCAVQKQDDEQEVEQSQNDTQRPVKTYEQVVITGARLSANEGSALERKSSSIVYAPNAFGEAASFRYRETQRERYQSLKENKIIRTDEQPVSTFSIDVDTGSYTNVRRMLLSGNFPVKDAVRVEEFINYFDYQYPEPKSKEQPFSVITELADSPWNDGKQLLMIGLKGFEQPQAQLPPSNLVFLVDVSGSMNSPDKLPLVQKSLHLLTEQLSAKDSISLVTYAGATRVVLESTPGSEKVKIHQAIDALTSSGSTAGAAGITLAYQEARKAFDKKANNRVILLTDGDFNVGVSNTEALKDIVARKRESGIFLTTVGFGQGNYNEHMMEQIADIGNGNYIYIDSFKEAHRAFVQGVKSTLFAIAKDVKIQIEFNPSVVEEYRLVGYENRLLNREDFNNDKVDAGDIGQGHTVTAIYEITLKGKGSSDPLRYSNPSSEKLSFSNELAFVKLRYKDLEQHQSKLLSMPVILDDKVSKPSDNMQLAIASAGFAQLLRGGQFITNHWSYPEIRDIIENLSENNSETLELSKLTELAESVLTR